MREIGIGTHVVVGIAIDERTIVTEYLEGVPLSESVEKVLTGKSKDVAGVEKYARVLAKLHKEGMVYGDTKAQNVLVSRGSIKLIDLEQAVENGDPAWDLAEFLYFGARSATDEDGMRLVADVFLRTYLREGRRKVVADAGKTRYLGPFIPFVNATMRGAIRENLKRYGAAPAQPSSSG